MNIRLGQWHKIKKGDKTLYQCSECGNVEDKQKKICCFCNAKMLKEIENDKRRSN